MKALFSGSRGLTLLLAAGLALCACGGSEPPAHPPKVEAVHPTVEETPPVASTKPRKP